MVLFYCRYFAFNTVLVEKASMHQEASALAKANREIAVMVPEPVLLRAVLTAFEELDKKSSAQAVSQSQRIERGERHARYSEVSESKAIPIVYNLSRPGSMLPCYHPEYEELWKLLLPLRLKIVDFFGAGYIARCIVVRLAPGAVVKAHIDPGWGFSFAHRVHWVLSTNSQSYFFLNRNRCHFSTGQVVEIDNKQEHSAENSGISDRVHVIVDYVRANDRRAHYCGPICNESEAQTLAYWYRRERRASDGVS